DRLTRSDGREARRARRTRSHHLNHTGTQEKQRVADVAGLKERGPGGQANLSNRPLHGPEAFRREATQQPKLVSRGHEFHCAHVSSTIPFRPQLWFLATAALDRFLTRARSQLSSQASLDRAGRADFAARSHHTAACCSG